MNCDLTTPTKLSKSFIDNEIFLPATDIDIQRYYHLERCPNFIFTHNNCNCYPTPYLDDKKYCCGCDSTLF